MANFTQTFKNIFKIEDLRYKILYTLGILVVIRVGAHITIPGIDVVALESAAASTSDNTLFGLFDMFVGGAFSNAAIFALGIMPYITTSIIFQLAGIVIPEIAKMQKEGQEGRRKINQWTRVGTVFISALNAWGMTIKFANQTAPNGMPVVPHSGVIFFVSTIFILTAGVIFMMWLGEQITERGIGNGISLIIMIGIIARLPASLWQEWTLVTSGSRHWIIEIIVLAILFAIIAGVVLITQGARRIPVQYARRQVGNKTYGGTTQYIPLRVNTAGVMPIIFAQALIFIPNTILSFFPDSPTLIYIAQLFSQESFFYATVYGLMIILFTFFYTAIVFNPQEISDNMKKQGGFVPGIRPGKPTAEYIERILTLITLPGSIFLAVVAILPTFMMNLFSVTSSFASFFGGTSLLIIVGVALDTLQKIESHLMMRHYDGFMKSGKIKGRTGIGGM
ncbi:MAG: preprotein translocase subunit SecY [Ignavibacteria bacterium GWF2_33_9]|nr:MAG: preprotein translocase subunit SecY [Ignavibacteria bacterium GWF2_33_9]